MLSGYWNNSDLSLCQNNWTNLFVKRCKNMVISSKFIQILVSGYGHRNHVELADASTIVAKYLFIGNSKLVSGSPSQYALTICNRFVTFLPTDHNFVNDNDTNTFFKNKMIKNGVKSTRNEQLHLENMHF